MHRRKVAKDKRAHRFRRDNWRCCGRRGLLCRGRGVGGRFGQSSTVRGSCGRCSRVRRNQEASGGTAVFSTGCVRIKAARPYSLIYRCETAVSCDKPFFFFSSSGGEIIGSVVAWVRDTTATQENAPRLLQNVYRYRHTGYILRCTQPSALRRRQLDLCTDPLPPPPAISMSR